MAFVFVTTVGVVWAGVGCVWVRAARVCTFVHVSIMAIVIVTTVGWFVWCGRALVACRCGVHLHRCACIGVGLWFCAILHMYRLLAGHFGQGTPFASNAFGFMKKFSSWAALA